MTCWAQGRLLLPPLVHDGGTTLAMEGLALTGAWVDRDKGIVAIPIERAMELLDAVGLHDAADKKPTELSGGMQQRVAIARALVRGPQMVLADEPTGNLDTHSSDTIFALLRQFNRNRGTGLLIVTHDPRLAARCDRIIELVDGRIASVKPNTPVVT